MRTIDDIDADLRVLAIVRVGLREFGGVGSTTTMDRLLDERLDSPCATSSGARWR